MLYYLVVAPVPDGLAVAAVVERFIPVRSIAFHTAF